MPSFRWPSVEALAELGGRLRFEGQSARLANDWVSRHNASPTALSHDQERRLAVEEWSVQHSAPIRQPHLLVTLALGAGVDVGIVKAALQQVSQRHKMFNLRFEPSSTGGNPERERLLGEAYHIGSLPAGLHRITLDNSSTDLMSSLKDLTSVESGPRSLVDTVISEASKPFDLALPPLFRAFVVRGDRDVVLLGLVGDRLVVDWSSMVVLTNELILAVAGNSPPAQSDSAVRLQPTRRQLRLATKRARSSMQYWRRRWKGPIHPLTCDDFPGALPPSDLGPSCFGRGGVSLGADLSRAVRNLGSETPEGVERIILAAALVALQHATQKSRVSIWRECRRSPSWAIQPTVGPSSVTHIVSLSFTRTRSVLDVLRALSTELREAAAHEAVPLELVARADGHRPTAPFGISFHHLHFYRPSGDESLTVEGPILNTDPSFPLQIISTDDGTRTQVSIAFVRNRLSVRTVETLLADIVDVLSLIVKTTGRQSYGLAEATPYGPLASGDEYSFRSHPSTCYLCRQREEPTLVPSFETPAARTFPTALAGPGSIDSDQWMAHVGGRRR